MSTSPFRRSSEVKGHGGHQVAEQVLPGVRHHLVGKPRLTDDARKCAAPYLVEGSDLHYSIR